MGQRLRRVRPKRPFISRQINFTGMRDALDKSATAPQKAHLLRNVYPQDPEIGGGLVGRPGFERLSSTALGNPVRHITSFVKNDGTRTIVQFAGTSMYKIDPATGNRTDVTGGMTIDAAGEIYTTFFANGLVVSDGVNKPFWWNGAASYTILTNAPVAFGQPVVYYAKLFFINANNRIEIMWSEENDPNLGYDQGGYNNAWQLVQVSQTPLYALGATESALYYFRDRGVGAVVGAVTPEFASTGVQEAVSENIGTRSPRSVQVIGRDITFVDLQNRPQIFSAGGTLHDNYWVDARETVADIPLSGQQTYRTVYWPWADLILYCFDDRILVFSRARREFVAVWDGFSFASIALVEDEDGDPLLFHGAADGIVYQHGTPDGTVWDDDGTAIKHVVKGSVFEYDVQFERYFQRLDMVLRLLDDLTEMTLRVETPNGHRTVPVPDQSGSASQWGEAVLGSDSWAANAFEVHVGVGLDDRGRWLQASLTHEGLGEKFGFIGWGTKGVHLPGPLEVV